MALGTPGMKYVFVNRFFYPDHSATSQLLSELVFYLAHQGLDVEVVTSDRRYDDSTARLAEHDVVEHVSIRRVPGGGYERHTAVGRLSDYLTFLRGARRELTELVDGSTVVVAKTDPPMLGMLIESVVNRQGGILVNWLQDVFPETLASLSANRLLGMLCAPLRVLRDRSLRRAGMNVAIGRGMLEYLESAGVPASRLSLIHNWPIEAQEEPRAAGTDFRQKWGLSDRFVVAYFGNLGRVHEHETMLEAIRALVPEPGIRFLFVGGGVLMDRLEQRVRELGLRNFERRGYVARTELPAALASADAHLVALNPALERYVVPSKFAGVAAAARPVLYIGDPDGELGRSVREWRCGYAVRTGDAESLAEGIRSLSREPGMAAIMGQNARRLYEQDFRAGAMLEKWRELLTALG